MGRFVIQIIIGLILVVLFSHSSPVQNQDFVRSLERAGKTLNYRLSNDTTPLSYNIWLQTRINEGIFTFKGSVEIKLLVVKETDEIFVHARQLKIITSQLLDEVGTDILKGKPAWDSDFEILTFTSKTPLPATKEYTLIITYEGTLREDNAGFYRSSYTDGKGKKRWLATTQFETTDARHAFPCYDEPSKRANFTITIEHGSEYQAISNMPVNGIPSTNGNMTTTTFYTTQKMPTYLVAFVISDFNGKTFEAPNFKHGVYSRPGTEDSQDFALEVGKKALKNFADYLNTTYDLPKMDQVAVPDFAAGAMENWGLVTYREEMLLYKEGISTTSTKTKIANSVAHEYSHQWFGNLVTPAWWHYTWLNEGFATLFAYIGTNMAFPEWNIMEYFISQEYQKALNADGLKLTRPMTTYVETPNDIAALFDTISYSKAGSVLRMIQHAMGENKFKTGLTSYLQQNTGTVTDTNLFDALENAAGKSIPNFTAMAESWSRQAGTPLLTVSRSYTSNNIKIKQERFYADGTTEEKKTSWYIPVNFVSAKDANFSDTLPQAFLEKEESTVDVSKFLTVRNTDWLLLNKQQTGYYRVNYDDKNWDFIIKALETNHGKIHTNNRAQLIDDSFKLALANRIKYTTALRLLQYIKNEDEYAPWAAADKVFTTLNNFLAETKDEPLLNFFIQEMVHTFYETVNFTTPTNEPHLRKFSRKIVVDWACHADVNDCQNHLKQILNTHIDKNDFIDPDMREIIYCNGLRTSKDKEFDFISKKLFNSTDAAERRELMASLGCILDEKLLNKFIQTSITYSASVNYRPQERINVLTAAYTKSKAGLTASIKWLKTNWQAYSKIGSDFTKTNPVVAAVRGMSERIFTQAQFKDFNEMTKEVKGVVSKADIDAAIVTVIANIAWEGKHRKEIVSWFKDYEDSIKGSSGVIMPSITVVVALLIGVFFIQYW